MPSIRVCRMCLAIDVRMFVINGTLEVSTKALFGESLCNSSNMPNYACYECSYVIQKFHKFQDKFITAQNILYNLIQVKEEITEIDISEIDRRLLNLGSALVFNGAQCLDVTNSAPNDNLGVSLNSCITSDENIGLKDEPKLTPVEYNNETIDSEACFSDFDDNDDVPLTVFKEIELNLVKNEMDDIDEAKPEITKKKDKIKSSVKGRKNTQESSQSASILRSILSKSQATRKKREKKPSLPCKHSRSTDKFKELEKDFIIVKLTLEEQQQEMEKKKDLPNYKDSPFKCEKCYKGFLHEVTLKNHMIYHDTKAGEMECPVCRKSVSSVKSRMQQHMMRHDTNYICRVCSFVAKQGYHAQRHANMHKGVVYKCPSCPETFKNITSQQTHVRLKHPSQHVCDFCGYSFVSEQGLKMHKAKAHRDSYKYRKKKLPAPKIPEHEKESNLYCSVCELKLADEDAWKRHLATSAKHRDTLEAACRDCGEEFPSNEALKQHTRSHARKWPSHYFKMYPSRCKGARPKRKADDNEYPANCELVTDDSVVCSSCWMIALRKTRDMQSSTTDGRQRQLCISCRCALHRTRYILYTDTQSGRDINIIQLNQCDVTVTSRKQHYTHYQRCHRDVPYPRANRDYMCEVCGQGFSINARLQYHRAKHRETRSFACPQCPKAFYSKEQLKSHAYSHTAVRPHACSLCGKGFKTKMALYAHVKRHEGVRRFPCQYCGKAFTTAPNMRTHIRQLHMLVTDKTTNQQET